MRAGWIALLLVGIALEKALAWGPEGHSIVAEIAQRHMNDQTRGKVDQMLGHGTRLGRQLGGRC